MKVVHKFHLPLTGNPTINMKRGARILDVQIQHGVICLWALVDSAEVEEPWRFIIVGTGYEVPSTTGAHIRTLQDDGAVWHIFEERKQ